MDDRKYRHEYKYPVTDGQIVMLKNRISPLLMPDPHVGENGIYNIRSLYFDDYLNSCYYENENGTDPREKFRIRIYNHSDERISLECKRKERGKTLKTSCRLSREQTETLMAGRCLPDFSNQPPLLKKLSLKMMAYGMKPVVIVEYERIPYVFKEGNVRITFDKNVSSASDISKFFDAEIPMRPIMPVGQQLMEVKFDEFLPDFIYRALQLENLNQTAYSKYYLCRRYSNASAAITASLL